MRRQVWAAMAVAAMGWGTGGVATREALGEGVEPYALAAYRTALAAAAVLVYLLVRRRALPRSAVVWKVGTVMGFFNLAAPFALFTIGYQYASAGFIGLLAALIPLGTALLAHFLLPDEPLTGGRMAGLAVALGGVAVLLLSGDSGIGDGGRPLLAFGLGLAAVVCIAYAGIFAKRYAGRYEPPEVATVQFVLGTGFLLVAMAVAEGAPVNQSGYGWALLAYMGLVSTFLPFLLFYWLLRRVSATYASVIGYIVPLVAVAAGALLLGERLEPGIVVGGALILAGVVITDRMEGRAIARPPVVVAAAEPPVAAEVEAPAVAGRRRRRR